MKHKIIFVSNTANFSKFNLPFMRWFREQGWQVDYCSLGEETVKDCDNQFSVCISRNPFNLKNFTAYKQLKHILNNEYDIIHCHTPMGGVIARLAAKQLWKNGKIKVIYTAHGFHFFKGSSLLNWIMYYPVEKYLAQFTDCIITINQEDYDLACEKFKNPSIFLINGVGVDLKQFHPVSADDRKILRSRYGYSTDDFIILYVAEFIPRKNHGFLIREIPNLRTQIPNLKVLFAGKGDLLEECKLLAETLGVSDITAFLGYRNDIADLCRIADIHVSPSKQEGLAVNNIEALASGLSIVCSRIRGHIWQ